MFVKDELHDGASVIRPVSFLCSRGPMGCVVQPLGRVVQPLGCVVEPMEVPRHLAKSAGSATCTMEGTSLCTDGSPSELVGSMVVRSQNEATRSEVVGTASGSMTTIRALAKLQGVLADFFGELMGSLMKLTLGKD